MKISFDKIEVSNGDKVIAEVAQAMAKGDHVIDFSNVKNVDSTVLAVILAAKRALKTDKSLQLQHAPDQLQSLVAAYGVQSLFS